MIDVFAQKYTYAAKSQRSVQPKQMTVVTWKNYRYIFTAASFRDNFA